MSLFKELSERFKTGTIALNIQVQNGQMAVMVTFKGIDGVQPRVLRGTPDEIDQNFIASLEQEMNMVSTYNSRMNELEELLKKNLEAKSKEVKTQAEPSKAEKEEKKKGEKKAAAAQQSIMDAPKTAEKAPEPAKPADAPMPNVAELIAAMPGQIILAKPTPDVTAAPVFEMPFVADAPSEISLTEADIELVLSELNETELEGYEVANKAWAIIQRLRSCTEEQARDLFLSSGIYDRWNKPKAAPAQNHEANVEALKRDLAQNVIPAPPLPQAPPVNPMVPPIAPGGFFTL